MKRQDRELRSELKQALRSRGIRDVRVVACGCLDLCPDHGIAVILGADLADDPRGLRVVGRKESVDGLAAMAADAASATRPHRS
ncbi:MAG: hypothetical protein J0L88_10470 [Xanthomonadales bacterium]|nr:hypothetical protein [Xanthomonadales bacterium]